MGSYNLWLVIVAVAILAVAWLPSLLKEYPLSYPILFVIGGWLLYQLPLPLPNPSPLLHPELVTHLTELCVIIALTGTGLKIDRRFSLRGWRLPHPPGVADNGGDYCRLRRDRLGMGRLAARVGLAAGGWSGPYRSGAGGRRAGRRPQ